MTSEEPKDENRRLSGAIWDADFNPDGARQPAYLPDDVASALGAMASERYQRRWIVNGTVEGGYITTADMLCDIDRVARWAGTTPTMPWILAIVHRFLAVFYECLDKLPKDIDIERDATWIRMRDAAALALTQLGHPIPEDIP